MNRQINNKNRNVHIGLVLVVLGILLTSVASAAEYQIGELPYKDWGNYYVTEDPSGSGRHYFAGYVSGSIIGEIILSNKELHDIMYYDNTNRTLDVGRKLNLSEGYTLSIKDIANNNSVVFMAISKDGTEIDSDILNKGDTYIYRNLYTYRNLELPTILIHIGDISNGVVTIDAIFQISEYTIDITGEDDCRRHMNCDETPIITPSPTSTIPIEPIPTVTVPIQTSTPIITPVPTATIMPVPTTTMPVIMPVQTKMALLNVTLKIDRSEDKAIVTIRLRNIGDDTARFVNLSIGIPPELGAEIISGAEHVGNKIIWKGDIEPGKEHEIIYKVNPAKIDVNMPLEIIYIGDEKVKELAENAGINSEDVNAEFLEDVDPVFLQKILFIIQITRAILPGFEIVLGILGIGTIYILRRTNRT